MSYVERKSVIDDLFLIVRLKKDIPVENGVIEKKSVVLFQNFSNDGIIKYTVDGTILEWNIGCLTQDEFNDLFEVIEDENGEQIEKYKEKLFKSETKDGILYKITEFSGYYGFLISLLLFIVLSLLNIYAGIPIRTVHFSIALLCAIFFLIFYICLVLKLKADLWEINWLLDTITKYETSDLKYWNGEVVEQEEERPVKNKTKQKEYDR